jgi:hypothetical protein
MQPRDKDQPTEKSYLLEQHTAPKLPRNKSLSKNENLIMSSSTVNALELLQEDLERSKKPSTEEETWEKYGRRTLYGSLPFMAAFGMQKKESTMKKVISAVSMNTLAKLHLDKELMKESEEKELEEVDVDEVRRSILCIF